MQETADTNASKDDINKNDVLEDTVHNKDVTQKRNKRKALFDGMYSTKISKYFFMLYLIFIHFCKQVNLSISLFILISL